MTAVIALLVVASVAAGQEEPAPKPPPDLGAEMARAVDLATPALRRAAVKRLVELDQPLDRWLAALQAFGDFGDFEAGPGRAEVPLQVGDAVEATTISYFVPSGYRTDRAAPLLLALHGTGATGQNEPHMWAEVAEEVGMIVVAPTEAGPNQGYRYSDRERDASLATVRWARRRFNVDENRVFVTGISRGGHLTWDLILRHPDQWAGAAPMIGGPRLQPQGGQNNLRYLANLGGVAVSDLQGTGDDELMILNLRLAFERLREFGHEDAELHLQEGHGHSFELGAVDWVEWFGSRRRTAVPKRVVRVAAEADERRSHWVRITKYGRGVQVDFPLRVEADLWNAMSPVDQRREVIRLAEESSARLVVERTGIGRFEAESKRVSRFELLLDEGMFVPSEPVEVRWGRKTVKRRAKPSVEVLLAEFVERFDRTFLPVARVEIR